MIGVRRVAVYARLCILLFSYFLSLSFSLAYMYMHTHMYTHIHIHPSGGSSNQKRKLDNYAYDVAISRHRIYM